MSQEQFWVLFSKNLSGEASAEEQAELQRLIAQHPEWHYALQKAEEFWTKKITATDNLSAEDAYMLHLHRMSDLDLHLDEVEEQGAVSIRQKSGKKIFWIAAATALLIISYFLINSNVFSRGNKEIVKAETNEVSTKPGSKSTIQLPDGSVVVLNAGSRLTYGKDFGKGKREVTLTGEGYFDVVKMPEVPFYINTATVTIKVLGTVFNVKAYPEDKKTETSLIRGSVEVTIKNRPNDKIILSPNEKLVVENTIAPNVRKKSNKTYSILRPALELTKVKYEAAESVPDETLWTQNVLVFRNETFENIAAMMERWYNVSIDIKNERLIGARLNGTFKNETVYEALDALKESVPFQFSIDGNKIIIR